MQTGEGSAATGEAPAPSGAPGSADWKWWQKTDVAGLNEPEAERIKGGGFTPQFGVAGGNAYRSIFDAPKPDGAWRACPREGLHAWRAREGLHAWRARGNMHAWRAGGWACRPHIQACP
jgi:hypothetical protein